MTTTLTPTMIMTEAIESPIVGSTFCGVCGSDASTLRIDSLTDYLTQETFQIRRCDGCGLGITTPLPSGAAINRYYPRRYRGNRHAFTGPIRSALRHRALKASFPKGFRGRLLDIGCGDGSFAMHMRKSGWEVCATEIDSDTVDQLCQVGVDAKLSHHAESEGFDEPFDAITCWHVMEHLEHPARVANWVRTQLSPVGIFQPTVPNAMSLQARVFGPHWVHLDVPRHRQHYSPATLRLLLEEAGFTVQRQTNFALEYDWFGVIQSALNMVCSRPNVLFDTLTRAPSDAVNAPSLSDTVISLALTPALAMASLPAILAAAAFGDGATLTLTCKANG